MPVVLATQEAKIRMIIVPSQPQAHSSVRPYLKKILHKKGFVKWLKVKALSSSHSITYTKKSFSQRIVPVFHRNKTSLVFI
jgi:hypothetical protein